MCEQCTQDILPIINGLHVGMEFRTPDNTRGRVYTVNDINDDHIAVLTQRGSIVPIRRDSFYATLHYLLNHAHNAENPCAIRSSNNREPIERPLCFISRDSNNNVRCINYILPILAMGNLVGIYG
jgi:hypothetical protein